MKSRIKSKITNAHGRLVGSPSQTIQSKVRSCLRRAPSTSSEIAAILGITIKNACARLRMMESRGQVRRAGIVGKAVLFEYVPRGYRDAS